MEIIPILYGNEQINNAHKQDRITTLLPLKSKVLQYIFANYDGIVYQQKSTTKYKKEQRVYFQKRKEMNE